MNYIQNLANKIKAEVPDNKLPDAPNIELLFNMYAMLLLAKGPEVTAEDVHNAWSAWMSQTNATHESIKPFSELSSDTQIEDTPFVDAIKRVAHSLTGESKR